MNDRSSLKIIVFYPRNYKAIIMALKQKIYDGFIEKVLGKTACDFLRTCKKKQYYAQSTLYISFSSISWLP